MHKLFSLERNQTLLMLIDIQEKLAPAIAGQADLIAVSARLLDAARILHLPVIVTEQYPKGLGPTVAELQPKLAETQAQLFAKMEFSAYTPEIAAALKASGKKQILLGGMETHICVFQTVRDLLAAGYTVQVAGDAVGSRQERHRDLALEALRQMGALITTSETAMYDLIKVAGTAEFRSLAKLIK